MIALNSHRMTTGERIFNVLNKVFLFLLVVVMIYPCTHVLFASMSDSGQLMKHSGFLFAPLGPTLAAYKGVFENRLIASGYFNTVLNLIFSLVISMVLTTTGAYALSRKEMVMRRPLMLIITFTMFFNGGLIPTYLLVKGLQMTDTRWALIIPTAVSAYNLIIMRTSFESIPDSLVESAKLDGANDFTILIRIAIPVSTAVVAVMVLFYAVAQWNAWFPAYIYLHSTNLWPLQLVLREIIINNNVDDMLTGVDTSERQSISESIKYATIVVATVPILFAYPFLQKYFVKGVMIGAIKG